MVKNIFIILIMSIYVFAGMMNQKMIITASKNSFEAEKVFNAVELFFDKQKQILENHTLHTKIEKLDDYFLVTVSPIRSISLRHELYSQLQTKFSDIFMIDNINMQEVLKKSIKTNRTKEENIISIAKNKEIVKKPMENIKDEKISFLQNIDNEWFALFALAMSGFMLIVRSNNQIGKIKKLQIELEEIQEKNDKQLFKKEGKNRYVKN
jgi:hypothetical protein